jgi:HAD superfamily hydrolase (TIGR01509 family)
MTVPLRAIFFDAGNTLIYPRVEELAADLTRQGYPASAEDFYAAERAGKQKLDEWLWPQIRRGVVPRTIDHYYWGEYLKALVERLGVPEPERLRLMQRVAEGFRDITLWSLVLPETPPFLEALRAQGYFLGVISNSIGTMEEQLGRVGLARHFDTVLDSALVGVEKPHPEIFQIALSRVPPCGIAPAETLFVGDTNATDMGGAQLAGLRGVLIDRVGAYPHATCPRITLLPELEQVLHSL